MHRWIGQSVAVPVPLHLDDDITARSVLELQRAAYAVEARLIGSDEIPGLHETLEDLQGTKETFIGVFDGADLIGVLSYEATAGVLDICRLAVAPSSARRGFGEQLVRWILDAVPRPVTIVSTGSDNAPAVALYAKLGFVAVGEEAVVPGLVVTHFEIRR